ncbi:MAG TPA: hypothetical protein PLP33_10395 [Leptospiraceae bacterium]|nr:hypothetical protein [Leptospiraceae bacterium]
MSIYKAGQYNVPNYQISGLPFVTFSGVNTIEFPYLTQWILVRTTSTVRLAFTQGARAVVNEITGLSGAFTEMVPFPVRVKKLYITAGTCYLLAGLTGIESGFELINTASLATISGSTDLGSTNIFAYSGI